MYAIIKTGGKQYKVKEGSTLQVEKIQVAEGSTIDFSEVLLVSDGNTVKVGTPSVADSKVTATVQSHGRGKKIKIIKFKRRKHHRKQMGHRQAYTELKITDIVPDINTWVPKAEVETPLVEKVESEETVTVDLENKVSVAEEVKESSTTGEEIHTDSPSTKKDEEGA